MSEPGSSRGPTTDREGEHSVSAALDVNSVIDCDVHNGPPTMPALFPYLDPHWQEVIKETGFRLSSTIANSYPPSAPTTVDPAHSELRDDGLGASTLETLDRDVFSTGRTELALLNCYCGIEALRNPDLAEALASAVNDWQVTEWLDQDARLRASLVVTTGNPAAAVKEIERLGSHSGFVQVLLPVRSQIPYGNRMYAPIFEAAQRHRLVIGIHFGGMPGTPPMQSGWPTYYTEEYVGMAQVCQSQVISLIAEGVFDRYPETKVCLIECGFTWIPSLMWRLDKEWKGLRREIPWVKRAPSGYIRDHMRASLQPLDAPYDIRQLLEVVEQIGSDKFVLFSTDYPHAHSQEEGETLLKHLPDGARRGVLSDNARTFYRL